MAITREVLRNMRDDIELALEEVGRKYNLEFKTGSARFTSDFATMKLEISTIKQDGTALSPEEDYFNRNYSYFGFDKEDLGRTFTLSNGETYALAGIKKGGRKMPILGKRVRDGKLFKLPTSMVLEALGKDKATVIKFAPFQSWARKGF